MSIRARNTNPLPKVLCTHDQLVKVRLKRAQEHHAEWLKEQKGRG